MSQEKLTHISQSIQITHILQSIFFVNSDNLIFYLMLHLLDGKCKRNSKLILRRVFAHLNIPQFSAKDGISAHMIMCPWLTCL